MHLLLIFVCKEKHATHLRRRIKYSCFFLFSLLSFYKRLLFQNIIVNFWLNFSNVFYVFCILSVNLKYKFNNAGNLIFHISVEYKNYFNAIVKVNINIFLAIYGFMSWRFHYQTFIAHYRLYFYLFVFFF